MRKSLILAFCLLLLGSCFSSYDRFGNKYYILEPYLTALDNSTEWKNTLIKLEKAQEARATGKNDDAQKLLDEIYSDMKPLCNQLKNSIKPINIPFTTITKNKVEVTSITTGDVVYLGDNFPYVNFIIKYKVLSKIRDFDFIQVECYDNENFCFSILTPEVADSGVTYQIVPLSKDWGRFSKIIID